jgi:hypothetical protein
MRVLCTAKSGESLSVNHYEHGYTPSTDFDLEIGKDYIAYGISLWNGLLVYLVVGEGLHPHWYPAELFTVSENKLPDDWFFAYFAEKDGAEINAIWGYNELVNNEVHFDGVSNLDQDAIEVFVTRKKEIDEIS